jgi:hypothetical protein
MCAIVPDRGGLREAAVAGRPAPEAVEVGWLGSGTRAAGPRRATLLDVTLVEQGPT